MNEIPFLELVNKQVCCYKYIEKTKKYIFSEQALGLLKVMYPSFVIVSREFDIKDDRPYIYIGDSKWINKIANNYPQPHIMVSKSGEYDMTDRKTVANLIFMKHNKRKRDDGNFYPKYLDELIISNDQYACWDDTTFYYNMKLAWILGTVPNREIDKNDLYLNIISNFSKPMQLARIYLSKVDEIGDDATKYLDRQLLRFMSNALDKSYTPKSKFMLTALQTYKMQYARYSNTAITRMLKSKIDNPTLKYLNYLLDICGRLDLKW